MTSEEKAEARHQKIADEERRLLRLFKAAGVERDFITCTELRLNVDEWLRYKQWLNKMMYPEE